MRRYTGGLDVQNSAIQDLMAQPQRAYLTGEKIYRFALSAQ